MILLTLGTQLPFERLVRIIDIIAERISEPIFGQIGSSKFIPRHFEYVPSLSPIAFEQKIADARIIVGHAGIGTLLSARRFNKPLVMVPRLAAYGEHRNDHQVATARKLRHLPGVYVANTELEIERLLVSDLTPPGTHSGAGQSAFIARLRAALLTIEPAR